jgi:glutathione S-transferase
VKLYGSLTSPFVRRIRIYLANTEYEFKSININDPAVRSDFVRLSPLLKIPVLEDGDQIVFDSRKIFEYLQCRGASRADPLSWDEENLLTVVDEMAQSLVVVLLFQRSNLKLDPSGQFGRNHLERVENTLNFLENKVADGFFQGTQSRPFLTNFLLISLYCYLDWALFRHLADLSRRPQLQKLVDNYRSLDICKTTAPRDA